MNLLLLLLLGVHVKRYMPRVLHFSAFIFNVMYHLGIANVYIRCVIADINPKSKIIFVCTAVVFGVFTDFLNCAHATTPA